MQAIDRLDRPDTLDTLDTLEAGMRSCLQFQGQDMLAHGLAVHGAHLELVESDGRVHYSADWFQLK